MLRILFVLFAAITMQFAVTSGVSAEPGREACARDVSRLCRSLMSSGDSVVLGCLKQHRGRLSRACDKILTEHGQ
jgi:hypothetical protein